MERRHFLKQMGISGLLLGTGGFPLQAMNHQEMIKLTVLHTNDVHSRIDPFPMDNSERQGQGGVARRMSLIKQIRASEKNVLLLDAGDIFQGTPYFNMYGGELEMKLMSDMGYDAATLGNHDFDNGLEGLVKQLPNANFPLINANYDFKDTLMQGKTLPFQIFQKGTLKIGVFGLGIELKGLVADENFGNTIYQDPVKVAYTIAAHLKNEMQCDYIICLSHLGFNYTEKKISDLYLAQNSQHIDLIIGGHTHTFLDKPNIQKNLIGKPVLVNQVGWAGLMLGRIDVYFERTTKEKCNSCKNIFLNQNVQ
jgi:5'-nucleotidase